MHVGGENNNESADEGAYLLSKELCKEYETSVLLAVKENGIPIIEKMDEITAAAMWSDAQVTLYQQRKILKYLRFSFGSKIIIPEKKYRAWELVMSKRNSVLIIFTRHPLQNPRNVTTGQDVSQPYSYIQQNTYWNRVLRAKTT